MGGACLVRGFAGPAELAELAGLAEEYGGLGGDHGMAPRVVVPAGRLGREGDELRRGGLEVLPRVQRAGAGQAKLGDEPVVQLSGGDVGFGQQGVEQGDAVLDAAQIEAELGRIAVGAERVRAAAAAEVQLRGARQVPQCLVGTAQVHARLGQITVEPGGVDRVGRPVGGPSQALCQVRVRGLRVLEAELEPAAQSEREQFQAACLVAGQRAELQMSADLLGHTHS
ncbi:hypothetical protein GCM10010313_80810 [Streptomyces violarus]|uniref:Uncharacterized protein n=1 Tax=Streptomyces violarus TaxID=67380 RepID=A0A7W5F5P2_9ACTN|nr:hypothetical protein [Streptomyces violarus]GHD34334.1 hypothetical protein GCM10010313_80810 [Streptomyces violarus]